MTRMSKLILLFAIASLVLATFAWAGGKKKHKKGERDPKWLSCSHISDCTVTAGLCGSPSGVNVRYLTAYDSWVQGKQAMIRCAGGIQVFHRAVVACEEQTCMAGSAPVENSVRLGAGTAGECHDLSDCIVSHGVCGAPLGVPSSKRKSFEKDVRRRAVAVDCASPVSRSSRAVLACEKQRCLAGPAPRRANSQPVTPMQQTKGKAP